ncbi:MAG: acyltransferase [Nitrospiraceae bacterium]|nr:MAG: acyltransferase [Nitrospiraceae bacterium]
MLHQMLPSETNKRIYFLDGFRALAILMVVAIHAVPYSHPLDPGISEIIQFVIRTIAVPAFFLSDGFLFILKKPYSNNLQYMKYVIKSAQRLLIPWFVFTIIYLVARSISEELNIVQNKIIMGNSLPSIIQAAYASTIAPQMYFLLSLFIIRTLSFGMKYMEKLHVLHVVIIFISYVVLYHFCIIPYLTPLLSDGNGFDPFLNALWGMQFYLAGTIFANYYKEFFRHSLVIMIVSTVVFIVFKFYCDAGTLNETVIAFAYLTAIFTLFLKKMDKNNILSTIGKDTMGIYLVHAPVMVNIISLLMLTLVANALLSYILVTLLTFLFSLLIVRVIYTIPYGVLLFGTAPPRE